MNRWVAGILAVVLWAAPWVLWWRTHRELQELRASQNLGPTVREVIREVRQPGETRVVTVPVPGAPQPSTARVEVVSVPVPGPERVVEVPRVVTVTPPVPCRTEEECRRIFGSAPQAISVSAVLPQGTVVPVLVTVDGVQHEVQAPLARDLDLNIRLVQSQPGVWHALRPETEPLKVTEVRTETTLPSPPDRLSAQDHPRVTWDHLRVVVTGEPQAVRVGLEYENWLGSGRYRIQAGIQAGSTGGWYASVSYVVPIR